MVKHIIIASLTVITCFISTAYCDEIKITQNGNIITIKGTGTQKANHTKQNEKDNGSTNKQHKVEQGLSQVYDKCVTLGMECYKGGSVGNCDLYIKPLKASVYGNEYANSSIGELTSSKLLEICRQMCILERHGNKNHNIRQIAEEKCSKFIEDLKHY